MTKVFLLGSLSVWGVFLLSGCVTEGEKPRPGVFDHIELSRPMGDLPDASPARRSAKAHTDLGNQYLLAERNGVALDEARVAIAADSGYAPAHMLMAMAYANQEQYALAKPSFEEAVRLAPGDPVINNAYGWFLCSQGKEDLGLQRLELAARNPYYATPTRAWTNAGLCLLRKNDVAGAEARFLRAVQVDPVNTAALFYLADISFRSGRFLRAKQWIDTAQQQISKSNVEVLWLAARIENKLGNASVVRAYGKKMREEFSGSNEYHLFAQGAFE